MSTKYEAFVKNTQKEDSLDYFFMGLGEEIGELFQLRRKELEGKIVSKEKYRDELGDILWFLTSLIELVGQSTLSDIQRENMSKISQKKAQLGDLWNRRNKP